MSYGETMHLHFHDRVMEVMDILLPIVHLNLFFYFMRERERERELIF